MIVDQVGEVLITNDGATILKRLDVEHPAGKVLVELAELQDKEVSAVVFVATYLANANKIQLTFVRLVTELLQW